MRYTVNDQVVLSLPLEGPLAAYIGPFAKWASEQGYAFCSLRRQVRLAACFSRWLGQKGVRVHAVSSEHAVQYLRYRARWVEIHKGDRAALRYLIGFLNRIGVTPAKRLQHRGRTQLSNAHKNSSAICVKSASWQ